MYMVCKWLNKTKIMFTSARRSSVSCSTIAGVEWISYHICRLRTCGSVRARLQGAEVDYCDCKICCYAINLRTIEFLKTPHTTATRHFAKILLRFHPTRLAASPRVSRGADAVASTQHWRRTRSVHARTWTRRWCHRSCNVHTESSINLCRFSNLCGYEANYAALFIIQIQIVTDIGA